ncbi:hypothetical protein CAMSH0001_1712 [Campylobacter showae RM3277]|uniref:Uncharacterized protein n=1 Tax=Campylobacter showae RM3277 TaxID=553219 RepID=C6REX8_9BACT|nr:hypothetical protein CAMSH0001_1712 [Campylobacter showae RM3277]
MLVYFMIQVSFFLIAFYIFLALFHKICFLKFLSKLCFNMV